MPNLPKAKIAIIGGTGLEDIEGLTNIQQVNIDTPFGKPSDAVTIGKLDGIGIAFLPRHGRDISSLPPNCRPVPISTR